MAYSGFVSIVGAGPGNIEDLTIGGLKAITQGEIIFYDALIGPDIIQEFPKKAKKFFVGKRSGHHVASQKQINEMLIRSARLGFKVVRLKGGDPYIFGRGGEEALALQKAGIDFKVIPGISAMNGIGARAGIPLTHRGVARSVCILEGHSVKTSPPEWHSLAHFNGTIIIYMGVGNLPHIAQCLLENGMAGDKPIALVESESGNQEIQRSTLAQVVTEGLTPQTQGPGIIYIGDVVNLSHELNQISANANNPILRSNYDHHIY